LVASVAAAAAGCSHVEGTYTDLAEGTAINLTATGTLDWVKWGNGENNPPVSVPHKFGVTPQINMNLTPFGTAPPGGFVALAPFSGGNNLEFTWTDGTIPPAGGSTDTVLSETILPTQPNYPLGLGAFFTCAAAKEDRILDVYVQGFNSDILITATLSGGKSDSVVISPSKNPASDPSNDYSYGRYRITFAGEGETLTVTAKTQLPITDGSDFLFPNAGFFAATLSAPTTARSPVTTVVNQVQQTATQAVETVTGRRSNARQTR
jgi:hypothetical protein